MGLMRSGRSLPNSTQTRYHVLVFVCVCALADFTPGTRAGPQDARVSENLHGDNHPAVSISFDNAGLVYQYDEDGSVKSMEVHLWIDGCVAGFDYLVHVLEHSCPTASNCYASQLWSQQITMLDDRPFFPSLHVKADFETSSLGAKEQHRFEVVLMDAHPGLPEEERKLAQRDHTFKSPPAYRPGPCVARCECFASDFIRNFNTRQHFAGQPFPFEVLCPHDKFCIYSAGMPADSLAADALAGESNAFNGSVRLDEAAGRGSDLLQEFRLEEKSLLGAWHSDACQNFYQGNVLDCAARNDVGQCTARVLNIHRDLSRSTVKSMEDVKDFGRREATIPSHFANEVYVSDEYKVIYTVVRKAGSSTISRGLHRILGATQHDWCDCSRCQCFMNRCTSLCLNASQISEYFKFTVVRDPVDRFYSAFFMIASHECKLDKCKCKFDGCNETMTQVLQNIAHPRMAVDHHFESVAMSIGTPVRYNASHFAGMPYDWIGSMDMIDTVLPRLLQRWLELNSIEMDFVSAWHNTSAQNVALDSKQIFLKTCRNDRLDAFIREVYAQDVACFGKPARQTQAPGIHAANAGQKMSPDSPDTACRVPLNVDEYWKNIERAAGLFEKKMLTQQEYDDIKAAMIAKIKLS